MTDQIIDAIGKLDDDMIEDVDALRQRPRTNRVWYRWAAAAACLCLIAVGVFAALRSSSGNSVQRWRAGFTAEDYFKNCGKGDAGASPAESKVDAAALPYRQSRSFADHRSEYEANGIIPVIDTHPLFSLDARYCGDGSLYCVELTWSRRSEKGLKDYSDLKVIAGQEEVQLISDEVFIELDEHGNVVEPAVTVTERDGVQIVARGGTGQSKTLTYQTANGWYQISGSWNDDFEPVAALLDWFWEHPLDFSLFPITAGDEYTVSTLAEVPDAFRAYLPDFAAFGFAEESTTVVLKNGVPVRFEGHYVAHADPERVKDQTYYDTEGYTCIHWCIFAEPDVYDLAGSLGELDTLSQAQITHVLDTEDNKVKFMQDGLLVILYPDDAAEAWSLIESLQTK